MVALSAFVTRLFIERRGFKDIGCHFGNYKWYLIVLIANFLMWVGPPLAAMFTGHLEWKSGLAGDELTVVILSLAGFSLLAGFGEEFGWRGYLLPRWLLDRQHARLVLLTIGLVWGVWHCAISVGPLLRSVMTGTFSWSSSIPPFLLGSAQNIGASIALSFIFGAVWIKTQSILLCAFLHGTWLAFRDTASIWLSYPSIYRMVTLFVVLAAWIVAFQWLKKYERGRV